LFNILKEHYNEHYDTVVDELNKFYKKRLLELPEKVDGFYLDSVLMLSGNASKASTNILKFSVFILSIIFFLID
jgi:hypothetical protein